ncbi:IAA-amino acid hydrolase ILR1-like 3 [Citrus sinensis]|nr:IAA-amino acid hydrolase ILR1-like 3 [Citrus sinensis]
MARLYVLIILSTIFTCHATWAMAKEEIRGAGSERLSSLTRELLGSAGEPEFFEWMKRIRRRIHENPELAFAEYEAGQLVRNELASLGIEYTWPFAKTGIVASVGSGVQPWFGLRADMDALPIQSKDEKFKNYICTRICQFVLIDLRYTNFTSKGTVKLVFQPGEESYGGAYHMIKEGALEKFQGIFGLHVAPELPTGTIGSRPGPMLAGSMRFLAVIEGKGGHAAMPHATRDPVLAASFAILALQQIVSRETDPLEARLVSVGFIEAGQAGNVIPASVRLGGTLRSMTTEGLFYLQRRVKEVIEMQAAVHQCSATLDFMEEKLRPYPATVNDEEMYEHAKKVGTSLLGEANVHLLPMAMGAEDFSFYSQKMAAALFMIGTRNETLKPVVRLHSPYLVIDEDVLPIGAALHAAVAISYLDDHAVETQ